MSKEKRIKYVKKTKLKHQTIWNYMRRNPCFRVSEIMMVCEVSNVYLQKFINRLEEAKYIAFVGKKKRPYSAREYRLANNTGVKAPKVIDVGLYDENINEEIVLYPEKRIEMPEHLPEVLDVIKSSNSSTFDELCKAVGIKRVDLKKWWEIIEKVGLITDRYTENEFRKPIVVYIFDSKRAGEVLKELKKGIFKEDPQLEKLWIQ